MGECVALCLIVLYLIKRAGGGFRSKAAAAGLYGLLVLRKGGSIVRKTLLDHWELAFVYMLCVAAASCWVVGASRKSKNFHETVRVACRLGVQLHSGVASTARLFTQDEVDAPVRRRRIVTQRL